MAESNHFLFVSILLTIATFLLFETWLYVSFDVLKPFHVKWPVGVFNENVAIDARTENFFVLDPMDGDLEYAAEDTSVQSTVSTLTPHLNLTTPVASPKTVLFWTTYFNGPDIFGSRGADLFRDCPVSSCTTSTNRADLLKASAVMFFGPDLRAEDVPRGSRDPHQYFIFYNMESPGSLELYPHRGGWGALKDFFNLTMTYRRDSDIFFRQYFDSYTPHDHAPRNRPKSAAWLVSHCETLNRREYFAKLLANVTDIEMFGKCAGRVVCPGGLCRKIDIGNLFKEHAFYLSFENTLCKDYVTEKLVLALEYDLIPIVYGGADYTQLLPERSYLNLEDFKSPRELAEEMNRVQMNRTVYDSYLSWKTKVWDFPTLPPRNGSSWCQLCELLHKPRSQVVSKSYPDIFGWWFGSAATPQCRAAKVLW